MLNNHYWQSQANIIDISTLQEEIPAEIQPRLAMARDFFQNGIILLMVESYDTAKEYLKKSSAIFIKEYTSLHHRDLMRLYITEWLNMNQKELDLYLTKARKSLEMEIYHDVMTAGLMEIFDIIRYCEFSVLTQESTKTAHYFSFSLDDKYPYEKIADLLIYMARILLLMEKSTEAKKVLKSAQQLFDIALRKIPVMMQREYPQWNEFIDVSDVDLAKIDTPKARNVLDARKALRGTIPLYRRQGEVLNILASTVELGKKSITNNLYERVEALFRDVVNPPRKKETLLGFVDDLEWVILRARYHYRLSSKMMPDSRFGILQNFLG